MGETADAQSVLNSQPIGADHLRLMLPLLFDDRSDARFGESPRAIVSEDEPPLLTTSLRRFRCENS